ncbi:MAG: Asp-tRNA(Asn)/Glu-tRNA(Gln) amidotransferase subunit GatC [Clostridiales bacterium]|nr:Asp-tRNA(Asn)/Glu-tRNA(Gln) amidotransferase subunit GatC [Clostridiales bacterium]
MEISHEEIKKLVELSALEYADEDYDALAKDFSQVVAFVEQLVEADIPEQSPTARVVSVDELREDEVVPSMSQAEILANAPEQNGQAFVVPKVVE